MINSAEIMSLMVDTQVEEEVEEAILTSSKVEVLIILICNQLMRYLEISLVVRIHLQAFSTMTMNFSQEMALEIWEVLDKWEACMIEWDLEEWEECK